MGFVALLLFSFFRALVRYGVIPQLTRAEGTLVVKRILLIGTILALLITVLGFGLKYREMSKADQQRVLGLLRSEFRSNSMTLGELVKNTATNLDHFLVVAQVLRHEGIPLLAMMFPTENLVPSIEEPSIAGLAELARDRVVDSGLLEDEQEVRRASEAARAIRGTIKRTRAAMNALMDPDGTRYPIADSVLSSHLGVLRKIEDDEMPRLNEHYSEWRTVRREYDVVNGHVQAYFDEVARFFGPDDNIVRLAELRDVLTAERFAYSVLRRYAEQIATSAEAASALKVGDTLGSDEPVGSSGSTRR